MYYYREILFNNSLVMKHAMLGVLFLGIAVSPALFVHAEEDTSRNADKSPMFAPIRKAEDAREKMQERQELFQERGAEVREQIRERAQEHASTFAQRLVVRFEFALERLQNIHDRIEERIAKIEAARDVDLSEAKAFLETAGTEIRLAYDVLEKISAEIALFIDSDDREDMRAEIDSVRELFREAKDHIIAARRALANAVASVKAN